MAHLKIITSSVFVCLVIIRFKAFEKWPLNSTPKTLVFSELDCIVTTVVPHDVLLVGKVILLRSIIYVILALSIKTNIL